MKYIDAEKLKAEIERRLYFDNNWIEGDKRRQNRTSCVSSAYYKRIGSKHACENILDFIASLQQEQQEVDLEKEYERFVASDPVYSKLTNGIVGKAIARHFYELGKNARKEK